MNTASSLRQPHARLALGIAASALLHAAVTAGVAPLPGGLAVPASLTVELRSEAEPRPGRAAALAAASSVAGAPSPTPPAPGSRFAGSRDAAAPARSGLLFERYYEAAELDERARPLNDVHLVYPKAAYEMRLKGRVVVSILINERGGIDSRSILGSEPAGVFDAHALAAVDALHFSPARRAGQPVKSRKKIEVVFDPYESINTP